MSGPVVLLVEDHCDTREMYAFELAAAGFSVCEAHDVSEALAATRDALPDIVVTDVALPGHLDAATICRHFRAKGVPVIAVTGVTDFPKHDILRDAGCTEVFMKPFNPHDLIAVLNRVLSAHPPKGFIAAS